MSDIKGTWQRLGKKQVGVVQISSELLGQVCKSEYLSKSILNCLCGKGENVLSCL